jgi:hypothetical protein
LFVPETGLGHLFFDGGQLSFAGIVVKDCLAAPRVARAVQRFDPAIAYPCCDPGLVKTLKASGFRADALPLILEEAVDRDKSVTSRLLQDDGKKRENHKRTEKRSGGVTCRPVSSFSC